MTAAILYSLGGLVFVVAAGVGVAFVAHEVTTRRSSRIDHKFDLEDEP